MVWKPIETVSPGDSPFMVWIDSHERPEWGLVEEDCYLDTTGQVVDGDGDPLEQVTHWRPH